VVSCAQTEGTLTVPQLGQGLAALGRRSVTWVVGCLSTSPVPNYNMEADAVGNMAETTDLANVCQVLLHKHLTSFLFRPMFC
jgi:hypothetical protein